LGFKNTRPVACEIFSAGVCNIECSYCYIPKVKIMKDIHKQIVDKIDNGTYIQELYDLYGENLQNIGLWGTEPTLTLSKIKKILPQLLQRFPKLKSFSWSSNFITPPDVTLDFLAAIPKELGLKVTFQASLDGDTAITDKNRAPGATKTIIENIYAMAKALETFDLGKNTVTFASKPTWDSTNIKYFLEDPKRLYDYFYFFEPLTAAIQAASRKNRNVNCTFGSWFTLCVPGTYTVEDGKDFAKLLQVMMDIEADNEKNKLFKYAHTPFNTYESRLTRLFTYGNELHNKFGMFTCSGGDSNFSLDERGQVHICHRSLFLNNADYVTSVMKTDDVKKWGVSQFDRGAINIIANKFVVDSKDQYEIDRFMYIMAGYHNLPKLKLNYSIAMLKELAKAGQVSEVYLHDDALAFAFALFANTGLSCPMENVLNTGIVHLQPVSIFRMFGNGAFELTLNNYIKRLQKTRKEMYVSSAIQ
jgi:sulfatase maturation enzyme AslB (radical SAM superfamily)